ncbi:Histidine kinase [Oscillospiraceae bacterium]|nr:Histidine kinase [Oscillospiraceae bacterium]
MISLTSAINISISVSGLAIALLGLILAFSIRKMEGWNRRFFIYLFLIMHVYIGSVLVYSVSSALGTSGNVVVSEAAMFMQSFSSAMLMQMMALLLRHFIWDNSSRSGKKHLYIHIIGTLWFIYVAILSMTLFNDRIYYFTPDNVYHRGPYYIVLMIPPMISMSLIFIALLRRRKDLTGRQFLAMLIYILIGVVCVPVQLFLKGIMIIVVGTSIAGIVMFTLLLTEQVDMFVKKTEENADQKVQLLSLQIRPHFVCNTLLSIYYLCDEDQFKAKQAILDFTDYLRKNFTAMAKESMVSFEDEIEHVRAYIAVEKVRYEDELELEFDIEDKDFQLPSLTLQPLVENSVKHGIDPSGNVLRIVIRSRRIEDGHIITVEDNGTGNGKAEIEGTHIALGNISNRLTLMCNGSLSLQTDKEAGTTVTIMIPDKKGPAR